ncbi:Rhamnogalacturonate lyase [Paramyrothecium foliicola]|nr:Rhamnogalacturonate lyase [Paramyrothecium foliicola]
MINFRGIFQRGFRKAKALFSAKLPGTLEANMDSPGLSLMRKEIAPCIAPDLPQDEHVGLTDGADSSLDISTTLKMKFVTIASAIAGFAGFGTASASCVPKPPFFKEVGTQTWIIGNGVWNMTQGRQFGTKAYYKDHDIVGRARGHHFSSTPGSNFAWNTASIVAQGKHKGVAYIDVSFSGNEGDMHWVIFAGQHGAYQYFVNKALPAQGEFRSLWRLDNATFPNGKTDVHDKELPKLSWYLPENKVQDETWKMPDGSGYITKYDLADWSRTQKYYGVYGDKFGSWYIMPGKDYLNGDHLKQELMIHRESSTGDAVQLNMLHGTHFQVTANNTIPVGKMWGPWLWYLNDGSHDDVDSRADAEYSAWPYEWLNDTGYQSRGTVRGQLKLSDGRPASGAAVFLGDSNPQRTSLNQGSNYYYTTYADSEGNFFFEDVRSATYGLQAWANGGAIGDVSTVLLENNVAVAKDEETDLGTVNWETTGKTALFQVGTFDRLANEFDYGGAPREFSLVQKCPINLTYTIGVSPSKDWCFGQTWLGTWDILFNITELPNPVPSAASLIVHLAGFSTTASSIILVNDKRVGNLTSGASTGPLASEGLANEQSMYRSATSAGEWRHFEFDVPGDLLLAGQNKVQFQVTRNSTGKGFMWDSVKLEW